MLMVACSKEEVQPVIQVPDLIQPYVDKFINEAKVRGIDIHLNGLKIYLQDSIPDAWDADGRFFHAEAFYNPKEHAIYFETSGQNINSTREEVIMHELGHAILKRGHKFDRFPTFDAQMSVMGCPCDTPVSGWTNKGHKDREKYYYDELFNPATPSPEWALK